MKKILSILALAALIAAPAFAADAEYTFREGVRTGVVTSLFSVAVSMPGNATIATNLTVGGAVASAAGITDTDADGDSKISAIGFENKDAVLVLNADQGDDEADTWTIKSEAADNDLSFVNGTTEVFKITSAGVATATDDFTCDKIIFTDAAVAAPTNTASQGFTITVNGTNYVIALYPN